MKRKNDLVPLYSTQRFIDLLNSINHEISYKLLEMIMYRLSAPISFLDFCEKNDSLTFVTGSKVVELSNKYDDDYRKLGWTKYRSSMRIGKALKLIFGNKYPINQLKGVEAPKPKNDIESFVNMYKAEREKNKNYDFFDIVKGEDIRFWYDQENYSRYMQEGCTLAKSCLRYKESLKFLDLYVKNPKVFSMLILKDSSNKLRARAIVWNLNEPENRTFMDRVYSINDFDVELFKTYARERGWLYKSRQTYGYNHNIIDSKNGEEYEWSTFIMNAIIKPLKYKHYPYLDTLSIYNRETGELTNNFRYLQTPPHIYLVDPSGSYVDNADYREMVFSRVYNDQIPRDQAEYVEIDDSWVYTSDAVYVHNTGGKKAFCSSNLIVFSNIGGKEKYFMKEDCVYSDYHNTYIYKDSVIEVYTDETKSKKILSHKRLIGAIIDEIDGVYILNQKAKEENTPKQSRMFDINWGDGLTGNIEWGSRRSRRREVEDSIFNISDELFRLTHDGPSINIERIDPTTNDEQESENTSDNPEIF